ncbi:hypothetical protein FO519_008351 [Halicephalobus sp. NKZ332]|nr:hypothetical protein FO519_008351 [Halicephalobus sp. NKZ332]
MSLTGVVFGAMGAGLGVVTYLALSSHFPSSVIAAWSSGTGGAGIIGSLVYAGLTEPHFANLSPKNACLTMLVVPALFAITYWFLMVVPDTVYEAKLLKPKTWLISESNMVTSTGSTEEIHSQINSEVDWSTESTVPVQLELTSTTEGRPGQRQLSFSEKLFLIVPMLKYMIPLVIVYIAEYAINQGLTELIYFDCSHGFHLSRGSQYRWYQVLYQAAFLGVADPPNTTVLYEGLLGGSAYSNTFYTIHQEVAPDVKEYSLSVATMADAVGIVIAAFLAMPLHNFICNQQKEINSGNVPETPTISRQSEWTFILPAVLVLYSIVKEIKIGEPFTYKYQTEFLNYTAETLNGEIYPYYAYAYLSSIIPILLFTDILLYKPIMYIEIFTQLIYRFTLVFTKNLLSQQIGQSMYAIATAADVAFSSYIYGKFEKDDYKKLTSWTRAGRMFGKAGGYFTAQLLILTHIGTYKTLNQIAFFFPCVALVFCFFMPRIRWKNLVARISSNESEEPRESQSSLPTSFSEYVLYKLRNMKSDFIKTYSNNFIRKWSFWWAMATCMSLQVALYTQTLFGEVQIGDDSPLNGFADAAYTFTSAVFIILTNRLPINWDKWGETALTNSIYLMYFCYVFYRSFYQVMITIAQWNIAKKMTTDSFGLVFGVNSFIALILQSILVITVTDKRGLGMGVRDSFLLYAAIHAFIALIFFISVIFSIIIYYRNKNKVVGKGI